MPHEGSTLIAGVSGGVDSMLLLWLLQKKGYKTIAAHVNYGLRGEESDGDEFFVRQYCREQHLIFETIKTEPSAFARGNIQHLAREIRYRFLEELRVKYSASGIVTAHHKDDQVETVLLKFFRGSYRHFPLAMLPQQQFIYRPLLGFSKDEIIALANGFGLKWREDSSNAGDDYFRNVIRNRVVPVLSQWDEHWSERLLNRHARWQMTEKYLIKKLNEQALAFLSDDVQGFHISLSIGEEEEMLLLISHILQTKEASAFSPEEVIKLMRTIPGKYSSAGEWTCFRERESLFFQRRKPGNLSTQFITREDQVVQCGDSQLRISTEAFTGIRKYEATTAALDKSKLTFPLILRPWQEGDAFVPFGMAGKKKISDFLIHEKVERSEKSKVYVLCSGEEICWVVGMRISDAFKLEESTTSVFLLTLV